MMVMEPLNEESFDQTATFITYAKIFPYILSHFVTRKDAKQMMSTGNLSVNTNVSINSDATTGTGTGRVKSAYDGTYPNAESETLKAEIKAKKESGNVPNTGE